MKITQSILKNIVSLFSFKDKPTLKDIEMKLADCYVELHCLQSDENIPEVQARIDDAVEYVRSAMKCVGYLTEEAE